MQSNSYLREKLSALGYYLHGLYTRVESRHTFLMAGGLAYATIICIIPIILLIFSALGHLFAVDVVETRVNELLDTFLPLQKYTPEAKTLLLARVDEFRAYAPVAGIVGGAALLFAARGLFSGMRTALDAIFPRRRGKAKVSGFVFGYLWGHARDIIMIIIVALFVLLAVVALPIINVTLDVLGHANMFGGSLDSAIVSAGQQTVVFFMSLLITALAFLVVYAVVPHSPPDWRTLSVSAVCATTLWELARHVFGWYLGRFGQFELIYGTFGAIIVFTLWIYYSAFILLIAAEIGQLYRERRATHTS